MKNILLRNPRRLIVALSVALYLRFLLTPTAWLFYELHHLTGVDAIYWGYSLFKGLGYYLGVWPYHSLLCFAIALLIAVPWRESYRSFKSGTTERGEAA